ncbi:hypothetical protein [Flavobacterium sp. W21_SRS_FM6]|uniref:hypothetical protein n=1 Tax=Flavobacterium sp. W21_SRS_FM6 TaxID=3240268 RepID=UPI003F906C2C
MEKDNSNSARIENAKLQLIKAKSLLLMLSSYHEADDQTLFAHDVDNVTSIAFDLVNESHQTFSELV